MKKKNFVSMVMGTIGGILFAVGMCMCLITEWNAFSKGVTVSIIGLVILLAMLIVRRRMEGKSIAIKLSGKSVGVVLLGIVGALTLGVGMCMTMVWTNLMIWGILVGCVGIVLLLCLIPLCMGIK